MKKQIGFLVTTLSIFFLFSTAHGAVSPIGIDIVPPIEFPPSDFTVAGLRLGLVGEHRNMYGIDLAAIGNITDLSFAGLAVSGIFNNTRGTTDIVGLQLAGITNINAGKTSVVGLQVAGAINANKTTSSVIGLNVAVLGNLSPNTSVYGLQVGLYNQAYDIYGFQIGLINNVTNLHGLQIGLINFNDKGLFKVCPILNAGF
jgi:hypothetical protein